MRETDREFREEARHAYLSKQEASAILRYRLQTKLLFRTFEPDDVVLDKLALSHAVENRRRAKATERARYLKAFFVFLAKLRPW